MTGNTYDRKCVNGPRPGVQKENQAQTIYESSRNQEKQPITRNTDKKQPIRHPEQKGVNRAQKKYSAINTAE